MRKVRPKIVFDNSAGDGQVCDDCPPANTDVLESIATCSQLPDEIWRSWGRNEK